MTLKSPPSGTCSPCFWPLGPLKVCRCAGTTGTRSGYRLFVYPGRVRRSTSMQLRADDVHRPMGRARARRAARWVQINRSARLRAAKPGGGGQPVPAHHQRFCAHAQIRQSPLRGRPGTVTVALPYRRWQATPSSDMRPTAFIAWSACIATSISAAAISVGDPDSLTADARHYTPRQLEDWRHSSHRRAHGTVAAESSVVFSMTTDMDKDSGSQTWSCPKQKGYVVQQDFQKQYLDNVECNSHFKCTDHPDAAFLSVYTGSYPHGEYSTGIQCRGFTAL